MYFRGANVMEILNESRTFYDPPYDSPLEDWFALNLTKYLDREVNLRKQVEVQTICGVFRLDFLSEKRGRRVAFECDGKQYHDPLRDEWRDGAILATNSVDAICRLRAKDLIRRIQDCLFVLAEWEPDVFSYRGKVNLGRLVSDDARKYLELEKNVAVVSYLSERDHGDLPILRVERFLGADTNAYWRRFYEYALEHGGGRLDGLIKQWWEEQKARVITV